MVEPVFDAVDVEELNRKAAGADVGLATDAELCAAVRHLAVARAALDAAEAHVLAELDVRGVCDREFGSPTLWWVTTQTRASRSAVSGRLRLASALRRLDVVDDALSDGSITVDHARVLADAAANPRISDDVVDVQGELVDGARRVSFRQWRSEVAVLVELLDQDGGYDPATDGDRNQLHVRPLGAGAVGVSGELVGDQALTFTQLLEAETDRLRRRARADHDHTPDLPVPSRSTLRALALVELLAKGSAGAAPTGTGPVVDITLTVRADDPDTAVTVDDAHVHADVVRHLRCDAMFTPVVVDPTGVPLDLGRTVRFASRAQRRALAVRDGGCVFPGCDLPVGWTDAHHVTTWDNGGTTELSNLASLCRHHHGVTHRRGWTMTADNDQTFTWTTPTGSTLHSQRNRGSPSP